MARFKMPTAMAILTCVALAEALLFHQIIWWFGRRGHVPLDLATEVSIVTILVAVPIIAFSQDVIRLHRTSHKALRALTRELADARDTLEQKVATRTAELSAANDALSQTITQLQVARDQAQTANETKSQFLANMSHELRTPLNAVLGFSEVIRDEVFGPAATAKYREYAGDIHSSGEHLLHIIGDLLDMSKIEADRLELHVDEIDVAQAVNAALRLIDQAAIDKALTLSVDFPSDLPVLLADDVRVKQILLNLLSNAVKFSRYAGTIAVGAAVSADGGLSVWVADTGIGMSEAESEIVFEPFRQIESSHTRKYQGTGLGLPLTRGLMKLHGGSITLTSAPQVGTTATVTFPPARVLKRGA